MSENENPTPSPSKQTSSIPLKKETVRVTLKAADAPPASPSAAIPPSAPPVRPPTPTAPPTPGGPPTPSARPTPTVGGAPVVGAPRPAPAATIPLKTAGAPPAAPKPAPTIRLSTAPVAPATPGLPTAPVRPGLPGAPAGGTTVSLPKATVQLQPPTSPLTAGGLPSQGAATLSVSQDEEEEGTESGLAGILSIVGFVAALVVLYFQISTANTWIKAEDNPNKDSWFSALTAEPGA